MKDLFIDPSKSQLEVRIESQSLHALGFEITVVDSDKNTVIEKTKGDTKISNPTTLALSTSPANSKDKYITGSFTVMSPDGKDYAYSILFSILEDNNIISPNISITGTTKNGQDNRIEMFHLI
ncbi:MAG: hypothetical protein P4L28_04955 [Paludibacteraceae bacterium]|nr:hypothetical protein [Paludibacteraceae bacterium]